MAIDPLSVWESGDTDYIATHNADNATVEAELNRLGTAKQDLTGKGAANGYAGLGSDSKLSLAALPSTVELTTRKGYANGYASLDETAHVPLAQLPIAVQEVAGGAGIDLTGYQLKTAKDAPAGYAGLDGDGLVPAAEIPDLSATYQAVSAKNAASGYAGLDGDSLIDPDQIPDLSATYASAADLADYVPVSEKGAASGVATLDAGGKVPTTQLDLSGYVPSGDLSGYIPTSEKGAINGVAELDAGGEVPTTQIPDLSGTYKILAYAEPVMFPMFIPGLMTNAQLIFACKPAFAVTFPASLAGTTERHTDAPADGTVTLTLKKGGSSFATIAITTGGAVTLTAASPTSFNGTTDELTVEGPATADSAFSDIGIALAGTR